jgi:hypothetical protein
VAFLRLRAGATEKQQRQKDASASEVSVQFVHTAFRKNQKCADRNMKFCRSELTGIWKYQGFIGMAS